MKEDLIYLVHNATTPVDPLVAEGMDKSPFSFLSFVPPSLRSFFPSHQDFIARKGRQIQA